MWKVLIADDEPKIRQGLKKWINELDMPFEVIAEAKNGLEAIALYQEYRPNLCLVDINMPIINGLEFIRSLKDISKESLIVIITGYDSFDYVLKALKLHVYDYLLKPVPRTDFINIMRKVHEEFKLQYNVSDYQNKKIPLEYSAIVLRVKEYLDENYSDSELNLSKVALIFNINKTYISKLMKQELGMSFIEYLTNLRLSKAKEIIKNDVLRTPMYEIAARVGYGSQHYFSRVFKNVVGVSPIEYRNNFQNNWHK